MYIPFLSYTMNSLIETLKTKVPFMVIQRFTWPGIEMGKGFMVSMYDDQEDAFFHGSQLGVKEGKLLILPDDFVKIEPLLQPGSGYRLFVNKLKEDNWNKRMLKIYEKNIINYLRAKTPFTRHDKIDINFGIEFGRVMATITNGEKEIVTEAIKLIG